MDSISELMDKYTGQDEMETHMVSHTCRISGEARLKLGFLASHLGAKKTRLSGEILEAAINEAFDRVSEHFSPEEEHEFSEEMERYNRELPY